MGVEYEWGKDESGKILCNATVKKKIAVIIFRNNERNVENNAENV